MIIPMCLRCEPCYAHMTTQGFETHAIRRLASIVLRKGCSCCKLSQALSDRLSFPMLVELLLHVVGGHVVVDIGEEYNIVRI